MHIFMKIIPEINRKYIKEKILEFLTQINWDVKEKLNLWKPSVEKNAFLFEMKHHTTTNMKETEKLFLPWQQSPLKRKLHLHWDDTDISVPLCSQTRHVLFWNLSRLDKKLQCFKQLSRLCGITLVLQQNTRSRCCFWCPQTPLQLPQDLHVKRWQSSDPSDLHCSAVTSRQFVIEIKSIDSTRFIFFFFQAIMQNNTLYLK